MKILKYPKAMKITKKNINLRVKVKCDVCKTLFIVDTLHDLRNNKLSWEDDFKLPTLRTYCPFCESSVNLTYGQCKKVNKWLKQTGTHVSSIKDHDVLNPINIFGHRGC